MELSQLLRERRSVHTFEDRPVSPELVMELLETAIWVPNHRMTQPWRFILTYGEGRRKIAEAVRKIKESKEPDPSKKKEVGQKFYDKIMSIPMILTVLMKEDPSLIVREEDYASTSCVIHNFSLLAWEKGIGLVWETYGWLHESIFRETMGIQPGEKVVGNLHIGYPAKIPPAQPRIPAAHLITVFDQA
ncbi:nitroreductase family protein [Thermaerobacillus caldiproteolyticus]|uniref:Putative NAD(P)H nitroreductase n=1 Tax=Thermaerobacillus caldiproteolyticus TaxID=247480 RepID=A0A7V9Z649_9BACL|nr:nitroreductase [Anoxybacillus caldiproteolyticus]MBA2874650.1 nitroreductase [Anoxybacillus caldiproteolyticus]